MKPCPNCGWMLKDTDARCSMCGHQLAGGAPAPAPAAYAPAPAAYAPPAPPMPSPAAYAPPPPPAPPPGPAYHNPGYPQQGYPAPPPPVAGGAYAQAPAPAPPPPSPQQPMPFSRGSGAGVSPWAAGGGAAMPPPPAPSVPAGMAPPPPPQPSGMPFPPPVPQGMPPLPAPLPAPAPPPPVPYGSAMVPPMVSAGSLEGAAGAPLAMTADRVEARPIADAGGAPVLIGFLVTFQNEPTGKFWPLRSGRTSLGRAGVDNEADVALPDASASARHAFVQGDPNTGQAFVEDAGSRNGTFINEQKIDKGMQRQLHDNDRLRLGSITLVVKLLASS